MTSKKTRKKKSIKKTDASPKTKKKVVKVVSKESSNKSTSVSKPVKKYKSKASKKSQRKGEMIFGRMNYIYMLVGIFLIILGLVLMSGGAMTSPDVWDDSEIYSFRRITLAPIVMLAGIALQFFAIFKRKDTVNTDGAA